MSLYNDNEQYGAQINMAQGADSIIRMKSDDIICNMQQDAIDERTSAGHGD